MSLVSNPFLDNYARDHNPPTQNFHAITGSSEVDRLFREKEDLLKTGAYTSDDPLIMELDRQIKASQLRGWALIYI